MNKAHEMLVAYLKAHPEESLSSVAHLLNTSPSTITRIAQRAGLPPRGSNRLTVADVEKLSSGDSQGDKENHAS